MRAVPYIFRFLFCMIVLLSCQKIDSIVLDHSQDSSQDNSRNSSQDSSHVVSQDSLQMKVDTLSSLRIAIIGDSISSFAGFSPSSSASYNGTTYKTYYPRGDVRKVENMWWYKVATALRINTDYIANCSWSGSTVTGDSSSTTSAYAGCSFKRVTDLSYKGFTPNLVLCFISCNDWARNTPIGSWSPDNTLPKEGRISTMREAYALMISKIKTLFPESLVVCLTNLDDAKRDKTPGSPSNNSKGVTVEEWNRNIKDISTALGCFTIDLQDSGIDYLNISQFSVDKGLHPNNAGMTIIANKVTEELTKILELSPTDML